MKPATKLERELGKEQCDKLLGKRQPRKDYQYTAEMKRENKDRK